MYIDWDNVWTTVISGTITGLVVGGILGLVGYFIWKRQHLYSKKLEVYTSFIQVIYSFSSMLTTLHKFKPKIDDSKYNEYLEKTNNELKPFLIARKLFLYYFGNKYFQPIQDIAEVYTYLRERKEIQMNSEELEKYILARISIFENIKLK
jgi:hypothetical protein